MKLNRLIGILTILLQKDKTTANELAERFEVSRRTILRDIDLLASAGIPITAIRGGDGGISIMDGYKINKNVLTVKEMQTLVAGIKSIDSVLKQTQSKNLITKLMGHGNAIASPTNNIIIDLSDEDKESLTGKIELLSRAIDEHHIVRFDYYYRKGEIIREIEPYFVQFTWSAWYIFGWCRMREEFRRFKLSRLWNLTITDNTFEQRDIPPEPERSKFSHPDTNTIKVLLDKSARYRLIEGFGFNSYEETNEGLIIEITYTNKEPTYKWILGFGDMAEVLEPEEAREDFKKIAKKFYERYN